jgi:hypothetical protein
VIVVVLTWLGLVLCAVAGWRALLPAVDRSADDLELVQGIEQEGAGREAAGRL